LLIRKPFPYAIATSPSRLRFFAPVDDDLGGGGEPKTDPEPKFPANTPVKDMTPEQQVAFHENKARRLEDQLKGFGGLTPKQVADLQKDLDDAKAKNQTAEEKAMEEAKEAGRSEVRAVLAAERVKTALEKALAGRIPDASALLDLDRAQFIKDGTADTDAIIAWATEHSTESAGPAKGHVDLGQGRNRGTDAPIKGVHAGRSLFTDSKSNKS
jgi:hypothetical protein